MKNTFVVILMALGMNSCGVEEAVNNAVTSATFIGSCNFSATSICQDYSGISTSATGTATESGCTTSSGTWSTTACDTSASCGNCSSSATGITVTSHYSGTAGAEATLQSTCEAAESSTWTDVSGTTCTAASSKTSL